MCPIPVHHPRNEASFKMASPACILAGRCWCNAFMEHAVSCAGALGYGGMLVPQEFGGMGLSMDDSCLLFEVLGAADPVFACLLAGHNLVTCTMARCAFPWGGSF